MSTIWEDAAAAVGGFFADDVGLPDFVPYDYFPDPSKYNAPTIRFVEIARDIVKQDPQKAQAVWKKLYEIHDQWVGIPLTGRGMPSSWGEDSLAGDWNDRLDEAVLQYGVKALQSWRHGGTIERAVNTQRMIRLVRTEALAGFPEKTHWYINSVGAKMSSGAELLGRILRHWELYDLAPRGGGEKAVIEAERKALERAREKDKPKPGFFDEIVEWLKTAGMVALLIVALLVLLIVFK